MNQRDSEYVLRLLKLLSDHRVQRATPEDGPHHGRQEPQLLARMSDDRYESLHTPRNTACCSDGVYQGRPLSDSCLENESRLGKARKSSRLSQRPMV